MTTIVPSSLSIGDVISMNLRNGSDRRRAARVREVISGSARFEVRSGAEPRRRFSVWYYDHEAVRLAIQIKVAHKDA